MVALSGPITVGVDVGGTKILGVALDDIGQVVTELRTSTPTPTGVDRADETAAVAAIANLVDRVIDDWASAVPPRGRVLLGVGLPGLVDLAGTLHFAPHLPWAMTTDIMTDLRQRLPHCEIVVDNDANCSALAESTYGSAVGAACALVITVGTGIGGGLVIDGRPFRGANGLAGEMGHMVIDPTGPQCPCGRRGCWELYASGSALGRLARRAADAGELSGALADSGIPKDTLSGRHVTEAALNGDVQALGMLAEVAGWLALGLANLVAIMDPSVIVVGGGLIAAGELLLGPLRSKLGDITSSAGRPPTQVQAATMDERSGAVGAAINARSLLGAKGASEGQR